MKKAYITGFTGQVGSQLADYLLENTNIDIYGMMRWQEPLDNILHLTDRINKKDRLYISYCDLTDNSSINNEISSIKPDFIFHLGAQSYPKTSFDIPIETLHTNILGTANILESVKYLNKNFKYDPVIHICSSSEVYGKAKKGVSLNEDTSFHGSSPYSISKIGTDFLGRFYGEAYNLKTFVTRMGTHSGPRRSDVFFESTLAKQIAMIEAGLQSPEVRLGNLDSIRTFQDCRDAVRAYYLLALESEKGKIEPGECFNIAGQEAFHLQEVVDLMLDMSSVKDIKVTFDKNRARPIDADYQMFDNTKVKNAIDWQPEIPAQEMFMDLLEFWRSQIKKGYIPIER
jgi:GDPmannose 4,6-dehydratase